MSEWKLCTKGNNISIDVEAKCMMPKFCSNQQQNKMNVLLNKIALTLGRIFSHAGSA